MARRLVDISVALEAGIRSDPPGLEPRITYHDHRGTIGQLLPFFPGLTQADLPDGEAWAIEQLALTTHNGTHLDAPWHFASTMNRARVGEGGEPAATIDQIPLEWCYQRGVKLDFRHLADGFVVTAADIERELERIGHVVRPLDIVLMNTAAGAATAPTTMSIAAAAAAATARSGCSNAACASPAPMAGAGTRRSPIPPAAIGRRAMRA